MKLSLRMVLCGLILAACDRHPLDQLMDPVPSGAVPSAAANWVLYDDELETGGGFYLIPEAANQTLTDHDASGPAFGRKSIAYNWNGGEVNGQHLFAGFGLLVAQQIAQDASTPPRNLSAYGFTKITFWAKGALSENTILRAEGPADGTGSTISPRLEISADLLAGGWAKYALLVPNPAAFASVKQYVNFTLIYTQPTGTTLAGEGGTVDIDQIAYEH